MSTPFPLAQWFDTHHRISKDDVAEATAQLALYAFKDGASDDELAQAIRDMRAAVKLHNASFPPKPCKPTPTE